MPTFARIDTAADLPALGARESPSVDFKVQMSTRPDGSPDMFEAAKDIAALASVYGGVLLVGACENALTGALAHWKRMVRTDAQAVANAYQRSARDRCMPVPVVDAVIIDHPLGDHVVAVNVVPVLHQPVGVKLRGDPSEGWGNEPTYIFPVRLSTHTIALRPDQIAMLMNPEVRRVMILLENIPSTARTQVTFSWYTFTDAYGHIHMGSSDYRLVDVDPRRNAFQIEALSAGAAVLWIPLDDVDTAWEAGPVGASRWNVRVSGAFDQSSGRLTYTSRPRRP